MTSDAEVLEEVSGLGAAETEALREEARTNLYFLASGVLGYKDVNVGTHGAFCKFVQSSPKRRRLGLMPRAHLKSTLATVADSIRLALLDPDNARILIAGETATLAEKFLAEIKEQFQNNDLLRRLFPELIPPRTTGPGVLWRSDMATIVRSSAWKEPTWQAIGVGGASVGSHFTRIKCDDLIGFEAIRSPAAMAYAKAWFSNIEPLLVNQNEDIIDVIGTRWGRDDLYAKVMEDYGESLAVFTRGAIEEGEIIFPQLHNWEEYSRIQRINPAQWHAQFENNPLQGGASDFPAESIRQFRFDERMEFVLAGTERFRIADLDRVLTVDPNSGSLLAPDAAACSVQGAASGGEVFVLESWSGRVSPSDLVDQVFRLAQKWRVRVVGIEKAGQQNTHHYFKLKAEQENYSVRVEEMNPRNRAKEDRIRGALEPLIRSHLLHLLPSQTTLLKQLREFPDTILWDEVDALAYGPELWRKPAGEEAKKRAQGAVRRLLALRNPRTGY